MRERLTRVFGPVRLRITIAAAAVFAIASTAGAFAIVSTVRNSLEQHARKEGVGTLEKVTQQLEAGTDPRRVTVRGVSSSGLPFLIVAEDGKVVGGTVAPGAALPRCRHSAPAMSSSSSRPRTASSPHAR
jgi:hypothetical protein